MIKHVIKGSNNCCRFLPPLLCPREEERCLRRQRLSRETLPIGAEPGILWPSGLFYCSSRSTAVEGKALDKRAAVTLESQESASQGMRCEHTGLVRFDRSEEIQKWGERYGGDGDSIQDKHNQPPTSPQSSPALGGTRRLFVIASERFRSAAFEVFWTKNQEAQIPVSGFLSITSGASPPSLEPNIPIF